MPRGTHLIRCASCRKQFTCGDCIETFCQDCSDDGYNLKNEQSERPVNALVSRDEIADEIRILATSPPPFDTFGLSKAQIWVSAVTKIAELIETDKIEI